jgi:hypothetical protein
VRLRCRGRQRLTDRLRLSLEPECLENPTATAREDPQHGAASVRDTQAVCGFRCWALKHTLQHDQNDGGNLPRQGQPRHFRLHAPSQQFRIELREGTGLGRGDDRRCLEKIFQINFCSVRESRPASPSVRAVLSQHGDQRCCWSRCRHHHRSIAAAWCGTGVGSAERPATGSSGFLSAGALLRWLCAMMQS